MNSKSIEMNKKCKNCWADFKIESDDLEFFERIAPSFCWKKFKISHPTLCPNCRQQRRLWWKNERIIYKRKCDLTGKKIISIYSPDCWYKVYDTNEWWSDKWDELDYWRDFNFEKSFFEQFDELMKDVPKFATLRKNCDNSDYCNNIFWGKDCYLDFVCWENEDSMYNHTLWFSNDCVDCLRTFDSTNCYELVKCWNCFNCKYWYLNFDCSDGDYLFNCKWVSKSIFCVWIKNKSYSILNKEYEKWDFEDLKNKIINNKTIFDEYYNKYIELLKNTPKRNIIIESSEDCIWDFLNNCNNCKYSFDMWSCQNVKYWYENIYLHDWFDCNLCWANSENNIASLVYESDNSINVYKALFTSNCWDCREMYYCDNCFSCKNCFWCTWLRNKDYCILNKQYSKNEYESIVSKIIEHMMNNWEWWEFFPLSISPFWYNETMAIEYYDLSRQQALNKWYKWQDNEYPINIPDWMDRIYANELPELKNLSDEKEKEILNKAIICETTWKPFRIIKKELEFYKKNNIELPRKHPNQRHQERMKMKNPRKLFESNCSKCWIDINTSYDPKKWDIVYCESCYRKFVD